MTRLALPTASLFALALAACQTTQQEQPADTAPAPAPIATEEIPLTAEELFPDRQIVDYTIQPGDSLWLIAENHKIPVADIRNANAIAEEDNKIIAGKSLRIPLPAGTVTATPEQIPPAGQPISSPLPNALTPSTLPGTLPAPPTRPTAPPSAESGLPAPPAPPRN